MSLLTESVPYEEAARIVADKQIMSKAAFDALCDELKARAFVVTGLEDLRAVQEIRDAIAELPRGAAWEDVKAQVIEKLEAGGFSQAAADYRATLLLRHHGFAAYAQENYRELREMQDVFPYWKYQSMGDEKVHSSHAALDGLILPADDPFWKDHFPPWEWNCRCQVVGVTKEEYDGARTVGTFAASDPDAKVGGWKLTPELAARLSQGQLDDGSGHPVMVTRTSSFHFDPSGPGLDLAEIQKRYDPADWARFKTAMKAEKLADGRSVWDWANGVKGKAPAAPEKPVFKDPVVAGWSPTLPEGRTETPRQDGDGAGTMRGTEIRVGEDGSVALRRPTPAEAGVTSATREKPIAEALQDAAKLDAGLKEQLEAARKRIAELPPEAQAKASQELREAFLPHSERPGIVREKRKTLGVALDREWSEAKRFIEGAVNKEHLAAEVVLKESRRRGRSGYDPSTGTIHVTTGRKATTLAHEFGHHLEETNPHLHERCADFLRHRAEASTGRDARPAKLSTLAGLRYRRDEWAIKDKFDDPYCGKVYSNIPGRAIPSERTTSAGKVPTYDVHGTELLSMGLQYMKDDPVGFFERDPEYYKFILNLLRGAI